MNHSLCASETDVAWPLEVRNPSHYSHTELICLHCTHNHVGHCTILPTPQPTSFPVWAGQYILHTTTPTPCPHRFPLASKFQQTTQRYSASLTDILSQADGVGLVVLRMCCRCWNLLAAGPRGKRRGRGVGLVVLKKCCHNLISCMDEATHPQHNQVFAAFLSALLLANSNSGS